MNENYTCKQNMPSRDADGTYTVPNPWIQWAKLGARVQKHYEFIQQLHYEILKMKNDYPKNIIKKEAMIEVIHSITQNYNILFSDLLSNGVADDS
jgi:hypothetical protein